MTTIDEIMSAAADLGDERILAHAGRSEFHRVTERHAELHALITHAIAEARADGAREMREFAAQESRWGGDSGCDADAMTAHIRALPLPTKREPVRLTDVEVIREVCLVGMRIQTPDGAKQLCRAIETAVLAANGMTK